MKDETYTLTRDEVDWVREALSIGLSCYGEIMEKENLFDLMEMTGKPWPRDAKPVHPTGTADVVSKFGTAFMVLSR